MKKISTNVVVALAAFLIGLASASALSQFRLDERNPELPGIQSDAMGNLCNNQS